MSIYSNDLGSVTKTKSSPYASTKHQQQALAPVIEDVTMSDSSHVPAYFPAHGPPLAASTAKLNASSRSPGRTPRFPSFERLWPLTSAFRTSIYSSPSTRTSRTKSSAASSAPSRSHSRHASRRGRKGDPKQLSIDALIGPTSLQQGVGLGRDDNPIDNMQIKHVRGAMVNDARYETAPILPAMSAQNNFFNVPPPIPSPTKPSSPTWDAFTGPTMPTPMPMLDSQAPLRRDNSLTLRDPGFSPNTMTTYQTTMPNTTKHYQTQHSQPHISRESSTRQPQPFSFPEPVRPAPTLRHPERGHHQSRSNSDGSRHKHRRERERPTEFVQSSTLLPTTPTDLGRPFQSVYPVGNLNGGTSRHHRQGSTSSNLDRQGSNRRTRSRSRSTSRTRSGGNQGTLVGSGHTHSRSMSNSGPTRSYSGSRGENPAGTEGANGSGSGRAKLRRSTDPRRARGVRPKIPSYEVNGQPPLGYGSGYEFNANGDGNGHYMSA